MKIGLYHTNVGSLATPEFGRLATLAEEFGYDSLWTAEHIVLPDLPPGPQTHAPGTMPYLDPITTLAYLAAHTHRMKLAIGVLLLPHHHPLLLAKQLATLDVLSEGRLMVGIGVGGIEEETHAMGVPMSERGSRADDYLNAMIALWTMEHPKYAGRHVSFEGINAYPRPVQQPHPPFIVGGRSEGALRRTVRYCAGWYGPATPARTVDETRELLQALQSACQKYQRPAHLGEIEITVAPREPLTSETIAAYSAIGVSRLLLRLGNNRGMHEAENDIRRFAPAINT